MIESLRIHQIKIVEEAELEFGPGLNVLTGETGAGKSIMLDALALLAGGKGSPDAVRQGAKGGSVEAVFRTEGLPDFEVELAERGFDVTGEADEARGEREPGDQHELLVHRTVSLTSRSRARVAGQLVPIASLGELFAGRIEIASQHSSQALLRPESHGRFLDAAGKLLPLRARVAEVFSAVREIDRELERLRGEDEERARRRDFLAFQKDEIDAVSPSVEEFGDLDSEHKRLGHAEQFAGEGGTIVQLLQGEPEAGTRSAADLVVDALRLAEGLQRLDPGLEPQVERLRSLDLELREVARDFERYVDRIESDPARLARVEERLGDFEKLRRKYGKRVEEILVFRDEVARELAGIEGAGEREDALAGERERLVEALRKDADKLGAGRKKAARKLEKAVQGTLGDLDMPDASFRVGLEAAPAPPGMPCSSVGNEAAEFQFCANPGEALQSLQKVASGGELSRVFLAIKNGLRRAGAGMVLVFDEVDAGIGGRAAQRVGQVLAELARHNQVLCITHLPQIAAFADVHFRVEKAEKKGRVCATVRRLEAADRVEEIARMAGGENVTAATRRHAKDLLAGKPER
jgi:DNA repair protein RecN (Recombination protein N)